MDSARPGEWQRIPGLFRSWEFAELVRDDEKLCFRKQGHSDDGTQLWALYRHCPEEERMTTSRYELAWRIGCVAIRDTRHPECGATGPGLGYDDADVVAFWLGNLDKDENWYISDPTRATAERLCKRLNEMNDEIDKLRSALEAASKGEING